MRKPLPIVQVNAQAGAGLVDQEKILVLACHAVGEFDLGVHVFDPRHVAGVFPVLGHPELEQLASQLERVVRMLHDQSVDFGVFDLKSFDVYWAGQKVIRHFWPLEMWHSLHRPSVVHRVRCPHDARTGVAWL
jgi:hypothetical protein